MRKSGGIATKLSIALTACILLVSCSDTAKPEQMQPSEQARTDVKIGCIVSEEYIAFTEQLFYMAQSLASDGFLQPLTADPSKDDAQTIWSDLCDKDKQDEMLFRPDCFYNLDLMEDEQKETLLQSEDVDLMLVFGTSSGVWLTQNAQKIAFDYMVFASADPISAGIVKSETERYNDRSFAHVDPGRIKRQIEFAYELSGFKSIGVVYEDSEAAYSYSGIRFLEELSAQYGFSVYKRNVDEPQNAEDYDRYYRELKEAYHSMLHDIDVLYVTTGMIEDEKLPWLLSEVHQAGIITVAETSESQVEYGAMMHITLSDAREEGQFAARTVQDYMRGVPIHTLEQVFLITPHIVLNQTTIEKTGAAVPMRIYLIADKVYRGEKDAE